MYQQENSPFQYSRGKHLAVAAMQEYGTANGALLRAAGKASLRSPAF
jgi:hypothetical protein